MKRLPSPRRILLPLLLLLAAWTPGTPARAVPDAPSALPAQDRAPAEGEGAEPPSAPLGAGDDEPLPIPTLSLAVPDARMLLRFTPATDGLARSLADRLREDRAAIEKLLGREWDEPIELRLGQGREEFAALQPQGMRVPGWAAGVAFPRLGVIVLDSQAAGRGGNLRTVLRHEIAHVALGRLAGRVPRWFTEGFALHAAGEWSVSRSSLLGRAAVAGALIPLSDLDAGWPASLTDVDLAYAQSASMVAWLAGEGDGRILHRLTAELSKGQRFEEALATAAGKPLAVLEIEWKRTLRSRYAWIPLLLDHEVLWSAAALLLVYAAWRRRQRNKRRLRELPDDPMDDPPELRLLDPALSEEEEEEEDEDAEARGPPNRDLLH